MTRTPSFSHTPLERIFNWSLIESVDFDFSVAIIVCWLYYLLMISLHLMECVHCWCVCVFMGSTSDATPVGVNKSVIWCVPKLPLSYPIVPYQRVVQMRHGLFVRCGVPCPIPPCATGWTGCSESGLARLITVSFLAVFIVPRTMLNTRPNHPCESGLMKSLPDSRGYCLCFT